MNWKKGLSHGIVSALLASTVALIYNEIYSKSFFVDFREIVSTGGIIGTCFFACFLMSFVYMLVFKWKGFAWFPWVNIVISVLSFASISGPLTMTLPLTIEMPEMFPGLAIPMHFFPALAFFTVSPFFYRGTTNSDI